MVDEEEDHDADDDDDDDDDAYHCRRFFITSCPDIIMKHERVPSVCPGPAVVHRFAQEEAEAA